LDRAAPYRLAGRTFFRDQAQVAHELAWGLEPANVADLDDERHGHDEIGAAQRLKCRDAARKDAAVTEEKGADLLLVDAELGRTSAGLDTLARRNDPILIAEARPKAAFAKPGRHLIWRNDRSCARAGTIRHRISTLAPIQEKS
jgi:hypothetical protein